MTESTSGAGVRGERDHPHGYGDRRAYMPARLWMSHSLDPCALASLALLLALSACGEVKALPEDDGSPLDTILTPDVSAPADHALPDSALPDARTIDAACVLDPQWECTMCMDAPAGSCPACFLWIDGAVVGFPGACCAQPCCQALGWVPCPGRT